MVSGPTPRSAAAIRQVAGVPENHSRDQEVQPGGALSLVFERAVPQFPELAEEDGSGERVAGLSLVQPDLGAASQVQVPQPVQQFSMNTERSSRPTSRSATASPFCLEVTRPQIVA